MVAQVIVMDDVLVVVSCRRRKKRRYVADGAGVITFFYRVVDASGPPSKDGPCPRASVEELFVQFGRRNQPG